MHADFYTVAVRTGGPGAAGVSLLLVERDRPGFTRTELKKMGWWCSDTATLHFDGVRVPAANLIGEENAGFRAIMRNFNSERLSMAAGAVGFAQACLEDALDWARNRQTFGQPLLHHQAIRHKLVDMQARVHAARALLYDTAWRLREAPREPAHIAQLAMLKNVATDAMQFCADAAVQTLGGAGFMRGTRAERIYREAKVMQIGGGSTEIMKDLAARQLGWEA
jgi:acyl-CoA dehydrogenase